MKRKNVRKWMMALGLVAVLALPVEQLVYAAPETNEEAAEETLDKQSIIEEINVGTEEELLEVAENCKLDTWSIGRKINLTNDIELSGEDFEGIAYFNGIFDGNGHRITLKKYEPDGSSYGLFRYIGELGTVRNVNLTISMNASGTANYIGGIAGTNYGIIKGCDVVGNINGQSAVGGIAGVNKVGGSVLDCSAEGIVLATNQTGGIVGMNEGMISGSISTCSVNIEELETVLDLGGIDLGSLNLTKRVVNRNNMGGIAGSSSGVITDCTNRGTIGFKHTGYNVGGIAGNQKGMILNCTNEGTVYGRKDVGGIVGQAIPYIESEYLEDKVAQTKADIDRLNRTMDGISASISNASKEAENYVNSLSNRYNASMDNINGSIQALSDSVSADHPEAQGYVDNINNALKDISNIETQGGELSQDQIDEIQNKLGTINDNLGNLQGTYAGTGESAEDLVQTITNELKNEGNENNLKDTVENVDKNIQSAANGISSAANQLNHIADNIEEELDALTGGEEIIVDISSIETAKNIDGVISDCVNRGNIQGDLNVGGIAGTMNVEYEGDPEFDVDLTGSVNVRLRSNINDVVIHSVNYGTINVKRNYAGGIVGLQEMGLVYNSEGYGTIESDSGNYLGGVVGQSAAAIQNSYSLCNIAGGDYIGGICGSGYTITDSISVSSIDSEGEYLGSIAGERREEGAFQNNIFAKTELQGVDNISYSGIAEARTYDEIMGMDKIPEGFRQVKVNFETDEGEHLGEKTIAYGGMLTEKDFPEVPEKDGYYVKWQESDELKQIERNLTVTAEYKPWTESLASSVSDKESKKAIFLIRGEFYEGTKLLAEETDAPEGIPEKAETAYAYSWKLSEEKEGQPDTFQGHFYVPDSDKKASLWIKQDGNWSEAETGEDGSYLTAEIPYGAEFALILEPASHAAYIWTAVAVAVVLLVIFAVMRGRRRMKKSAGR